MKKFDDEYNIAKQERKSYSKYNNFSIVEIQKKPKFYNWVECYVNDAISFNMFLAGGDDGVALKFFWNGHYESYSLELWTKVAALSKKLKIDVGAHTGAYTLAALTGGQGPVVCFEPHFVNYSRLMINLRANGFNTKNAFMFAVGEAYANTYFYLPTGLDYLSTGGSIGERKDSIKFPVQLVNLDKFIAEKHHTSVEAIKIDVEGFEMGVLKGALNIISKSKPIIFFESIEEKDGNEIQKFLEQLGYNFWLIDDNKRQIIKVNEITPERDGNGDLIMSRLNRLACIDNELVNKFMKK